MFFEGLYYDGQSSAGHRARIQLHDGGISIDLAQNHIQWSVSGINTEESAFNKNNSLIYYGTQFPYTAIEVNGDDFQVFFKKQFPDLAITKNKVAFMEGTGTRTIVLMILGVLGFLALAYFYLIPAAAEKVAEHLPQQYEIDLGNQIMEQMSEGFQVDSEQTALANAYFQGLNYEASYPAKITVVHDKVSNAFALPGGNIVVYDQMFKVMKDRSEFSALLSHEYSHVTQRHTTRSLFRGLATYLVISLIMSDVNGVMAVVLQNADNLKSLSYSRSLEQEADDQGLNYMEKAGENPQGMIDLFKHLGEANEGSQDIPEFLSTHPMLDARKDAIKARMQKNKATIRTQPELDAIWKRLKELN